MSPNLKAKILMCDKCQPLGINFRLEREDNLNFAYKYKPDKIKFLWIVESPPKSDPPRYFYRPELTKYDSLFRETMKALGIPVSNTKNSALKEFQSRGNFLIDSMKCPADKDNSGLKLQMANNCKTILKEEIISLEPEKILIIKADVYTPVVSVIKEIDIEFPRLQMSSKILNKSTIPFPASGQQVRFREKIKELMP